MSKLSANTENKLLAISFSLLGILSFIIFDYTINLGRDKGILMITDENGFYQPKPNLKTKVNYGELAYNLYTDEDGYRISIPSQDNRQQPRSLTCPTIYFIGDSFTWGSGLNFEYSYPGIFAKTYSGKIVNMGVDYHLHR